MIYFQDFSILYRVSNNGPTSQEPPTVYEIYVYSDEGCSNEIVPTYVSDSGHKPGNDGDKVFSDGSAAFDKDMNTYWRPQCEKCHINEAWITFMTNENAGCVRAYSLGKKSSYMCFGGTCWDNGIKVELEMADGSWGSVMTSDTENTAKGGIGIYLYYLYCLKIDKFNV